MRSIVRRLMGIGSLFHFLGVGSTVFFPGSCAVMEEGGASFSSGTSYEFFSESERAEMEEESWEVLTNAVPAALALAIKMQDPLAGALYKPHLSNSPPYYTTALASLDRRETGALFGAALVAGRSGYESHDKSHIT
ncbi:unnamed protein product [Tuber aestivum]|uniref:Uncharacterized protein n=1 Tax=Tuber aestivum TaxID=59557 RepID=A0A292PXM2_9PEZI|nr:unnamed protein product [Tuber aestivum]